MVIRLSEKGVAVTLLPEPLKGVRITPVDPNLLRDKPYLLQLL